MGDASERQALRGSFLDALLSLHLMAWGRNEWDRFAGSSRADPGWILAWRIPGILNECSSS